MRSTLAFYRRPSHGDAKRKSETESTAQSTRHGAQSAKYRAELAALRDKDTQEPREALLGFADFQQPEPLFADQEGSKIFTCSDVFLDQLEGGANVAFQLLRPSLRKAMLDEARSNLVSGKAARPRAAAAKRKVPEQVLVRPPWTLKGGGGGDHLFSETL